MNSMSPIMNKIMFNIPVSLITVKLIKVEDVTWAKGLIKTNGISSIQILVGNKDFLLNDLNLRKNNN